MTLLRQLWLQLKPAEANSIDSGSGGVHGGLGCVNLRMCVCVCCYRLAVFIFGLLAFSMRLQCLAFVWLGQVFVFWCFALLGVCVCGLVYLIGIGVSRPLNVNMQAF